MVYTLTLNPALDYTLYTDGISFDDINRAKSENISYGGKGINVSVILNRLGVDNTALGFAAGFTGKELIRLLENDGIRHNFILLERGNTRINVKIRTGQELDINANGNELSSENIEALKSKLNALLKDGDILVLSGSLQSSLSSTTYADIMDAFGGRDILFALDTSGDALLESVKRRPFIVKPNHIELGDLFDARCDTEEEIITCAKKLQSLGARNVLVSRAENGALLFDENGGVHKAENAEGTLVNSVGCGDSMLAGFIAGYKKTGDYDYALRLATACGNATAYSKTLATKEEIKKAFT